MLGAKIISYDYTTLLFAPYSPLWRDLHRFSATKLFSAARTSALSHIREVEMELMVGDLLNSSAPPVDGDGYQRVNLMVPTWEVVSNMFIQMVVGKRKANLVAHSQISCGMASESEGSETGITRQMSNLVISKTSITLFSYLDIERATDWLSDSSRMWSWRYGRYYKGYLDDSTEVYIKMLDPRFPQDEADFVQELNVLEDLRHPNLPEFVGACIEHPAVFYKFPTYDNLELCLEERPELLTRQIRTSIIYQICSTLIFLYSNKRFPIIHGHLTPANILLDRNFNCTVSIPEGTATSNPNPIRRFTEYIETGNRKLGDDVYSLGIMVLRLLTGLSAATIEEQAHGARIVEWSMAKVDQRAGNWPSELAEELAYFGAKCWYSSKSNLLHMEGIMKELGNFLAVIDNFKNKETVQCPDY